MAGQWGDPNAWNFNSDAEDEHENQFQAPKSALLLIISASPEMFRPWGRNDDKPIVAALKACEAICRSKIISSPKDKVGIVFSSTEQASNSLSCDNLYVLHPLSEVTTFVITDLRKKFTASDLDGFEDKIGSSTECNMSEMFWLANMMFDDGGAKNMNKKIMFFTSEDNPHADDSSSQQNAVMKFKDIGHVDFSIISFHDQFDRSKFYGAIVEEDSSVIQADNADSLLKVVRMKQRVRRPLNRTSLELAPGITIGVGVYSFVRKALKPRTVPVNIRTNEAVIKSTTTVNTATGLPVLKAEATKFTNVAGEEAEFTSRELKDWKYNFNTGIFLIGFMDQSQLNPLSWYRQGGYFLYPDEKSITGSKDLFTALLRRCDALQKVALVRFVKSRGQDPKLACLIPAVQANIQFGPSFPQGFHLMILPFANEIRHHDVESAEATPQMVALMENVVKKLTKRNFNVMDAPNPELHYTWKEIESSALNLERDDEEFEDFTIPNIALMQARAGEHSMAFNDEVTSQVGVFRPAIAGKQTAGGSTRAPKVPRLDFNMQTECENNRLEKLTVAVLKAFTDEKKISVQATYSKFPPKKSDYVTAIQKFYK